MTMKSLTAKVGEIVASYKTAAAEAKAGAGAEA